MRTGNLILALMLAASVWPSPASSQETRAISKAEINVWDGDTFRHRTKDRIRLRTCNAPEFLWRRYPPAERAMQRLIDLIDAAKQVEIVCIWKPPCRDRFGRLLCDLRLDGKDACDTLIAAGLAKPQQSMSRCSRHWPQTEKGK